MLFIHQRFFLFYIFASEPEARNGFIFFNRLISHFSYRWRRFKLWFKNVSQKVISNARLIPKTHINQELTLSRCVLFGNSGSGHGYICFGVWSSDLLPSNLRTISGENEIERSLIKSQIGNLAESFPNLNVKSDIHRSRSIFCNCGELFRILQLL